MENGVDQGMIFVLRDRRADTSFRHRLECAHIAKTPPETIDELLKIVLGDDTAGLRDAIKEFEICYGGQIYSPAWVLGFFYGALNKFRGLEEKLNVEKSV